MKTGYSWDTGLVRKVNEDSILCTTFDIKAHHNMLSAGLFAVADGMGGHNAGEIASDLAIRTIHTECIDGLLAQSPSTPLSILSRAFARANSAIFEAARDGEMEGMGTTLTVALVIDQEMFVAHLGDSRCYIINPRETLQVTKDHSFVQQLIDSAAITPEQALTHPRRNEITRVLGYQKEAAPDYYRIKMYSGDTIVLCSDGLSGVLPGNKITYAVIGFDDPWLAAAELAAQANLLGGPDNISVIVVKPDNLPSWQAMISAGTSIGGASAEQPE